MSICRAHNRTQPKYSRNASNALRVPTAPQTHESLCCSEAVDIQDDERLQRCCGTASWRQLADSWKRLIFNQVQCHLWKTTDSVAGVFKCRHRGREHWRAGYLGLNVNWEMSASEKNGDQHRPGRTMGEMTTQDLWSRYVRHFVGITCRNVCS